ncbi:myb-like protein X [Mangifera indica]|uniref:myb-like protein X n=1 Tax=Mangifera indica TaxID=29780 RepID=UPI001CFAE5E1|nr:myb-like protein X [Mangifera indica]
MGCFFACFGASKDAKHRKLRHRVHSPGHLRVASYNPPVKSTVYSAEQYSEKPVTPVSGVGIKADEEQLSSGTRKKVTFDSNVKTFEPILPEEVTSYLPEISEVRKQEKEKEREKENLVKSKQEMEKEEEKENLVKSKQSQSSSEASSITSSSGSYPSNYRYQNCRESDDEEDELELDSDLDNDEDEEDDKEVDFDDMSEDDDNDMVAKSRIAVGKADTRKAVDSSLVTSRLDEGGLKPIQDNRRVRDRSAYVHSVLNPVENLTQWKAVKNKGKPQLKHQKENFTDDQEPRASFSLEPSFKELSLSFKTKSGNQSKKPPNQEVAVDASLSNWLPFSETTPINKSSSISLNTTPEKTMSQGSNSLWSQEDRPILGALTLEEIKQFSSSSSPRKSPSRSPDEMPIIGSVGSYWSPTSNAKDSGSVSSYKGIPNTTSKYREDKAVNWYSTPFETRLERALNRNSAGYSTHKFNVCQKD